MSFINLTNRTFGPTIGEYYNGQKIIGKVFKD